VGGLTLVTPAPPTCDGDRDCDGVSDLVEQRYGSNPQSAASKPESRQYDQSGNHRTCSDGIDNDRDGKIDDDDTGCG
jgi:hypothetical protein